MGILWFAGMTSDGGLVAQSGPSNTVLGKFLVDGGWITWFVLIPLSVISIALIIHYLIMLRRSTQMPAAGQGAGRGRSAGAMPADIVEITREDDTMLGQAAYAGVLATGAGREAARAAIDEAVEEQATRLFRRIEYLNVIGNISPMIGLLGTVVGMIQAFARIYSGRRRHARRQQAGRRHLRRPGQHVLGAVDRHPGAVDLFAFFRNRIDAFAAEMRQAVRRPGVAGERTREAADATKAAGLRSSGCKRELNHATTLSGNGFAFRLR